MCASLVQKLHQVSSMLADAVTHKVDLSANLTMNKESHDALGNSVKQSAEVVSSQTPAPCTA